jgi:ketosteroid isomerase-like protein
MRPSGESYMQESWEEARGKCQAALDELVQGRPEPFKALWSRSNDTVIMGAFGGFERGSEQVANRLDWASAGIGATGRRVENVLTVIGEDLACTVDLEHMERTKDGRTYHRVLRCTQVYRLEDGEWRVIVRHADELPEKDASQK